MSNVFDEIRAETSLNLKKETDIQVLEAQGFPNTVRYHLYVESKKQTKNKTKINSQVQTN